MGKRFSVEDSTDKFHRDELPLSVILNLLRIEFLLGERKDFAGDDLSVVTCRG